MSNHLVTYPRVPHSGHYTQARVTYMGKNTTDSYIRLIPKAMMVSRRAISSLCSNAHASRPCSIVKVIYASTTRSYGHTSLRFFNQINRNPSPCLLQCDYMECQPSTEMSRRSTRLVNHSLLLKYDMSLPKCCLSI